MKKNSKKDVIIDEHELEEIAKIANIKISIISQPYFY